MSNEQQHTDPRNEPGGEDDPSNPRLAVPSAVRVLANNNNIGDGFVSEAEIDWMASQRPLVLDPSQLARDFGDQEAALMFSAIRAVKMPESTAAALAWPGVGTRWQRFLAW